MIDFVDIAHLLHPTIKAALEKENNKLFEKFKPNVLNLIQNESGIDTSIELEESQEWLIPVFAHILEYLAQGNVANLTAENSEAIKKRYSEAIRLLQKNKVISTGSGRFKFGPIDGAY